MSCARLSYILKGKAVYLNRLFYKFSVFYRGEARRASAAPEEMNPSYWIPVVLKGVSVGQLSPWREWVSGRMWVRRGSMGQQSLGQLRARLAVLLWILHRRDGEGCTGLAFWDVAEARGLAHPPSPAQISHKSEPAGHCSSQFTSVSPKSQLPQCHLLGTALTLLAP